MAANLAPWNRRSRGQGHGNPQQKGDSGEPQPGQRREQHPGGGQQQAPQASTASPEEVVLNINDASGSNQELQLLNGGMADDRANGGNIPPPSTNSHSMSTSTLSVLDCLWDLLQDAPRLLKDKPQ